jgi:hypothetical protein
MEYLLDPQKQYSYADIKYLLEDNKQLLKSGILIAMTEP